MDNYELVNFCEFDRYASRAYCAIHGVDESLNLGDINEVDETKLPDFTMICGGSPCQDFSVAGKGKGSEWHCKDCDHKYNPLMVHYSKRDKCPECGSENIEKTRSSLLVEWLRVIRAKRPSWGLYENVKNIVGKKFKTTFDLFIKELHEYGYNTYYKVLNAKDYGIPQNRERVYVFFVKQSLDNGMFQFPEPFELQLRLKDVLNEVVDEKFYLSNEQTKHLTKNSNWGFGLNEAELNKVIRVGNCNPSGKGQNGTVIDADGVARTVTVEKGEGQKVLIKQVAQIYPNSGNPQTGRIYDVDGISPSLDTCTGGNRMPKIMESVVAASRGRNPDNPSDRTTGSPTVQRLEINNKGISNTITSVQKDNYVIETTKIIRKLLPIECYRLMGFSDEDFLSAMCGSRHVGKEILSMHGHDCLEVMEIAETKQKISNTQLYKQAGNSIVVDVLYYIYNEIYRAMPYLFDNLKLCSLFSGIGAFESALDRFYKFMDLDSHQEVGGES